MVDEDELEKTVNLMESQIKAKKSILEEVLRTVENEKDKTNSAKKRSYIRDILKCEVLIPCSTNDIFSISPIDSFRFENHIIARFSVTNHEVDKNLLITISTCSSDCLVRWILFENQSSSETCLVVGSNQSAILCVAIPFNAFFKNEKLPLNIHGKAIQKKSKLLNAFFYSTIESNQSSVAPREAFVSESVSTLEAVEELDLKSIGFMDEKKAIQVLQSLFLVFSQMEISKPLEFSLFRRLFPGFLENDFDTWRLYVGTDRFDGILIYTESDEVTRIILLGRTETICSKFMEGLNEKCFET